MSILDLSQLPPALLGSHSCQAEVRHLLNIFSSKCYFTLMHAPLKVSKKDFNATRENYGATRVKRVYLAGPEV